jgi:transposase
MRLLATYLSSLLGINVSRMQTWRIIHDLGIVYKQPKLELQKEKDDDYEQKKGKIYRWIQEGIHCPFKKRYC